MTKQQLTKLLKMMLKSRGAMVSKDLSLITDGYVVLRVSWIERALFDMGAWVDGKLRVDYLAKVLGATYAPEGNKGSHQIIDAPDALYGIVNGVPTDCTVAKTSLWLRNGPIYTDTKTKTAVGFDIEYLHFLVDEPPPLMYGKGLTLYSSTPVSEGDCPWYLMPLRVVEPEQTTEDALRIIEALV